MSLFILLAHCTFFTTRNSITTLFLFDLESSFSNVFEYFFDSCIVQSLINFKNIGLFKGVFSLQKFRHRENLPYLVIQSSKAVCKHIERTFNVMNSEVKRHQNHSPPCNSTPQIIALQIRK
eukprot:NODE_534_length_6366_cov_0.490825.p5 type:complete len:121 gc:universal NODE_534_length_6366_cov_0.490825:3594-3956(+)